MDLMDLLTSTYHLARFELLRIARVPTVMAYFLGPLLVYPALIWGEIQVLSLMEGERATTTYQVATASEDLVAMLDRIDQVEVAGADLANTQALDAALIDAYVTDGPAVHHATWSVAGTQAARLVADGLEKEQRRIARKAFLDAGGTKAVWNGHDVDVDQPRDTDEHLFRKLLGLLVALMTPLSVLVTASQPACAVFLSDREEGTAETLLTTRAPRTALAAGKIAAVVGLLVLSSVANALLLWAACMQALTVLSEDLVFVLPTLAGGVLGLLTLCTYSLLLALLLTTLMVPLRTYKEGQSLGSTGSLPVMGPVLIGALTLIWGESASWMAWCPFVHTPLLLDAALRSTWTPLLAFQTLGIDLLVAGLWLAVLWRFPGPVGLVVGAWRPDWLGRLLGSDT